MSKTELKPCPFCGHSEAEMAKEEQFSDGGHYVRCQYCGAQGECCSDKGIAIEMWNTRHTDLALVKEIAELRNVIHCEGMDPCGTIWEHAAKVQKENRELKEWKFAVLDAGEIREQEIEELKNENERLRKAIKEHS